MDTEAPASTAEDVATTALAPCTRCGEFELKCQELRRKLNVVRSEKGYWRRMHRKAVEREKTLKEKVTELEAKLRLRERQLFARKSERGSKGQKRRDAGPTGKPRGQQKGTPGHGRRSQDALQSKEERYGLEEKDRLCPCCGLPYDLDAGTEDSEVVEVEVQAHRRRIRRQRYGRRCMCEGPPLTLTAPGPSKLIPKGAYGVSFWSLALLDKFLFQRPTYRLLTFLALTLGLVVSRGTVTGGFKRLKRLFVPLYEAIVEKNRSESRWHADETRWMVFVEIDGKRGHRWYLWVFRSSTTMAFRVESTRSSEVPKKHFGENARGILNVDRYAAYKVLLKTGHILLAFCWAHVRRDFLGVAKDWPKLESWGLEWVARISELYRLNQTRLEVLEDPDSFPVAQAQLVEAVDKMAEEREEQLSDPTLHSACRKVLKSLREHWPGLVLFVEHPEVAMDNNESERILRGPVVGRKNYYGSGSLWSAELTAILFSLFQTLLLWRINPRVWLHAYLEHCAECAGEVPADATSWLPWNLTEEQLLRFRISEPDGLDSS